MTNFRVATKICICRKENRARIKEKHREHCKQRGSGPQPEENVMGGKFFFAREAKIFR